MKKDDFSLIRSGLASELYLLFFLKTDSTYEHAKIIKKTKGVPDVSKIYLARGRLKDQGFIEKKGLRYYPVIEKLAESISYLLKQNGKRLNKTEFNLLCFLLRNFKFVHLFSPQFIKKITKQSDGSHNIDALALIGNTVGNVAFSAYLFQQIPNAYSKFAPKHRNVSFKELEKESLEIEEEWNKVMEDFDKELEKELKKDNITLPDYVMDRIMLIMKSMPLYVVLFDKRFTKKLSVLGTNAESLAFIDEIHKTRLSK